MNRDILLIRDGAGYRVLHGYLRLACLLDMANEAEAEAQGEGIVRVVKTRCGILVDHGGDRVPLLTDCRPLAPA